jgi:hypothetical protein
MGSALGPRPERAWRGKATAELPGVGLLAILLVLAWHWWSGSPLDGSGSDGVPNLPKT